MEVLRLWKESWQYPTSLLCIYGFFSTVKPLEPFLIPFLTGPDKNLTVEQVTSQVFPVWTYSYLAILVPVFMLTDWLRYKPVIVFQCCALFGTNGMLLWLRGVKVMQVMQFVYAMVTACDVAYFSYIYSQVAWQHYLKVTSYCRSVQLLGFTVGSLLGQILVSFSLLSYNNILVLTLVLISIAMVTALLLPMPRTSMFFHQRGESPECVERHENANENPANTEKTESDKRVNIPQEIKEDSQEDHGRCWNPSKKEQRGCCLTLRELWRDVVQCYSRKGMVLWSLWWMLSTCGYNQTVNYVQVLWDHTEPSNNFSLFNGATEALSNLFGAGAAYSVGCVDLDWSLCGEMALGVLSASGGTALFAMVFSGNIWVCYTGYVVFKSLYMLLITITMFQIAAGLSTERYALVFGANTFGALVLQTVLTSVVVDSGGLGLDIVPQFIIYGSYFSVIALLFILRGLYMFYQRTKENHREAKRTDENQGQP
ncbi:thiamine transporter 2 [Hoplias malabaricus]|uniref:thiamine transporter 2 n=1 Tax=Hoplias malabaricus TaxID=27720 RepID=UPI00346184BC